VSTKTLVSELVPYCGGLARSTGNNNILKLIERGEDKLFDYDSPMTWWIGTENKGWPPYLKTTAGTYKYTITNANLNNVTRLTINIGGTDYPVRAKKVLRVFVDATNVDYGKRWVGQTYLYSFTNPYTSTTSRTWLADIPADSGLALENTSAWVRFREDLGTTTEKYFVLFTYEPPRLISEDIPLAVPLDFEDALIDFVIGTVNLRSHGKANEWMNRFYSYWVPKWRQDSASGTQTQINEVVPRFC
jgi:hypothetical protein